MIEICYYRVLVAQLFEALHRKPDGHGFDSRCCHWNPASQWSWD
jgi:hypothetical protein